MINKEKYKKLIFGIHGYSLTAEELDFINEHHPMGCILFARNLDNIDQIQKLTAALQSAMQVYLEFEPWILIDQEGGRVNRLKDIYPDIFNKSAYDLRRLVDFKDLEYALIQTRRYYSQIGSTLRGIGINTNCAPVADLHYGFENHVIGDRSFDKDPQTVIAFVKAAIDGLKGEGIRPIIKHIPGHGCAELDSHHALPIVKLDLSYLEKNDFAVFQSLKEAECAMTAHVLYNALDPNLPVTLSLEAMNYIRDKIGYQGLIISDDLCMKALDGTMYQKGLDALKAGCNILLHCNGNLQEIHELCRAFDAFQA